MLKKTIILFLLICNISSFSQVVYEHINNNNIYDFLDELANIKIIELNSVIKPYDKMFIYKKLKEAKINQKNYHLDKEKNLIFI